MTEKLRISLSEYVQLFLDSLFERPRTRHTYEIGLRIFQKFMGEQVGLARTTSRKLVSSSRRSKKSAESRLPKDALTLSAIDTNVLENFQSWLSKHGYSRFSQRTYVASVVAFLNYALSHDWLPATFPFEKARAKLKQATKRSSYPIPRPDPALPRLIAYYDEQALPEGDDNKTRRKRLQILRSRAFVHLLYSSAGRLAEVAALNRKDVADGRRREAIVKGKGEKERFIFITPDAKAAISAYVTERKDEFEPLFISHGKKYGARLSHDMLWETVKRAAKELGIDVSPHDFRHYRASQMLQQGAPLEAIQEILGHSDIGTTRRVYAHYSKPAIRSIFEKTTLSPKEAAKNQIEE
jgi:site-specific recombinase XerD